MRTVRLSLPFPVSTLCDVYLSSNDKEYIPFRALSTACARHSGNAINKYKALLRESIPGFSREELGVYKFFIKLSDVPIVLKDWMTAESCAEAMKQFENSKKTRQSPPRKRERILRVDVLPVRGAKKRTDDDVEEEEDEEAPQKQAAVVQKSTAVVPQKQSPVDAAIVQRQSPAVHIPHASVVLIDGKQVVNKEAANEFVRQKQQAEEQKKYALIVERATARYMETDQFKQRVEQLAKEMAAKQLEEQQRLAAKQLEEQQQLEDDLVQNAVQLTMDLIAKDKTE